MISFVSTVQIILIVLKLTNNLSWSWWGVFSPVWVVIVLHLLNALANMLRRWMNE